MVKDFNDFGMGDLGFDTGERGVQAVRGVGYPRRSAIRTTDMPKSAAPLMSVSGPSPMASTFDFSIIRPAILPAI